MKINILAISAIAGLAVSAQAQIFHCTQNGKRVLTDKPCAPGEGVMVHRGQSPESAYQEEMRYQQALEEKAIRQQYQHSYQAATPQHQYQYRQPAPAPSQRPKTVSTLLPNGGSIAEREAHRQAQKALRPARPTPPAPSVLTHCAGGFCYDDQGGVYHGHGPRTNSMTGPNGNTCFRSGNMVNC